MTALDKTWHLAITEEEIKITEFELQLWRVFYGFLRWQEECERTANDTDLTGNELAILHIIRMKDRPKSIYDIGRVLNRDDTFNIHYSIRKLIKKKLIKKITTGKRMFTYQITEEGINNTDTYSRLRRNILIDLFIKESDLSLEDGAKQLAKLKTIYDEADQIAASSAIPTKDKDKDGNDYKEPVKRVKRKTNP